MWYKIPTHVAKIYKGWKIDITVGSFSKTLTVTISPGVEYNFEANKHLPSAEQAKLYLELDQKISRYTHTFKVQDRFLGIFEFKTPWNQAFEEAKQYIDGVGPFNYELLK